MGEYTARLTIFDERNGEIVGEQRNIEIEDCSISEEGWEQIEEFVDLSIQRYEEDEYGL